MTQDPPTTPSGTLILDALYEALVTLQDRDVVVANRLEGLSPTTAEAVSRWIAAAYISGRLTPFDAARDEVPNV